MSDLRGQTVGSGPAYSIWVNNLEMKMNTPVWRGLAQTGGIHFYQNLRDFTNQIKQTRLSGHSKGKENAEISL